MEMQALVISVTELHKKVDTLTNMVSDLLLQIDEKKGESSIKRRKMEEQVRQTQDMMMGMPGVKGNPMAQKMIKSMLSVAGVPDPDEEKGCGGKS